MFIKKFAFLFLVLLLSFMATGCTSALEKRVLDAEDKIFDLENRIVALESSSVVEEDTETKDALSTEVTEGAAEPEVVLIEYPFESCDDINSYSSKPWFLNFKTAFETIYPIKEGDEVFPNFSKLRNACFSSEGNVLIALQLGVNMNAGFHIFKYSINSEKLSEAYVNSGQLTTFATPSEFGRRHGNLINMFANSESDGCTIVNSFEYNYIENILYLKESCDKCPNAEEVCQMF